MTLEDEQSYLLGEKDHLLFTVQERKLTIDKRGNLENIRAKLAVRAATCGEQGAMLLSGAGLSTAKGCFSSKRCGQLPGPQNLFRHLMGFY